MDGCVIGVAEEMECCVVMLLLLLLMEDQPLSMWGCEDERTSHTLYIPIHTKPVPTRL